MSTKDIFIVASFTGVVALVIKVYGDHRYNRGWKNASILHNIVEESQNKLIESLIEKLKEKEKEKA